ncbi:hypothetical protein GCM10011415_08110 [Salipiger pallidus]|uniref:YjiS-like domain-containing protein n=1 Tax=Salipiger pallidus TaxID=1775170 RepID=A0A8J3EFF3_9RHOB|nr:DUF1127 domain-containing protein [Salipiger pallidus]GGG64002.1 hypothetical protein GCM10011415_08110 [Salipiger pallidus]
MHREQSLSCPVTSAPPAERRRRGLLAALIEAHALWQQRRRLPQLDDHLLRDMGITRAEAEAEAARKPWDAPRHWSR